MAPPFREVEFDILYGEGISREGDLLDLGAECDVDREERRLVHLRGRAHRSGPRERQAVPERHPDVARKIEAKVLAHHGIKRDVGGPALAGGARALVPGARRVHTLTPRQKLTGEREARTVGVATSRCLIEAAHRA